MQRMLQRLFQVGCAGIFVLLTVRCQVSPNYHEYKPVPSEGWGQGDVISFPIDSILQDGDYVLTIGVRTTGAYPFQTLYLLVEQDFTNPIYISKDTLKCRILDVNGDRKNNGISVMQYAFPLRVNTMNRGQRGTITLRHIMRREILPGVADVGINLDKK
ncbi:MAG: gliding motility lipoprotein GldH [Bacteroidaceae bacterium]